MRENETMAKGCVFDIREFTVHDGPGVRTTVFLKGCPMRCVWCHNPEGLDFEPQKNLKSGHIVGKYYEPEELAMILLKHKEVFQMTGGGVTFSGGEATAQAEFVQGCLAYLKDIHLALDTSGMCKKTIFEELINDFDLVLFDLKLLNQSEAEKYTGCNSEVIITNYKHLANSGIPYRVRIPLIPDITDTYNNLSEIKELIVDSGSSPNGIDLLPYNRLAGGKYALYGMNYKLENNGIRNRIKEITAFREEMTAMGYDVSIMG